MQTKLTPYEKYIINQIEIGQIAIHLSQIVNYKNKRIKYYIAITHLKELEIVQEMSDELIIISNNKYYKSQMLHNKY
jgi:hypothetical protein